MQIQELKQVLATPVESSETWLQNQYPARPFARYSDKTYLNYQNLEDCFPTARNLKDNVARLLTDHPETKIVILAALTSKGNVRKKPVIFLDSEASYYGNYELFASACNMQGFIETFHNIQRGH